MKRFHKVLHKKRKIYINIHKIDDWTIASFFPPNSGKINFLSLFSNFIIGNYYFPNFTDKGGNEFTKTTNLYKVTNAFCMAVKYKIRICLMTVTCQKD